MAFEYVCKHPVSSEMIQRLLGHAMVLLVLNRPARCCGAVQFGSARFFSGIIPLLVGDMRRPWSPEVFCSDASPDGYGICARSMSEHENFKHW